MPTRHSLLSRLRNLDDTASWHTFFNNYWRLLYNVARKSGLNDDEAQDVVQETVIAVARKMPEFRYDPARGSFKQWLLLITRRRIHDHLRRAYRTLPPTRRDGGSGTRWPWRKYLRRLRAAARCGDGRGVGRRAWANLLQQAALASCARHTTNPKLSSLRLCASGSGRVRGGANAGDERGTGVFGETPHEYAVPPRRRQERSSGNSEARTRRRSSFCARRC
ncbi:MAG: sigma-70 family RNA polymerase sigma factor [Verrucomicrobia bacterium]|nr:sigma-70 family RNA polymerase sigma factor [Verrucomicrobiota bacterium]